MPDQTTTRWIRNAADEYAVSRGCRFDERRAEHPVEFFRRYLRHSKGEWAGKPFELVDWQRDELIKPLFGWVNEDGNRRFNTAVTLIPKKNGKSTIASGVGLYLLAGDGEPGNEVYSVATKRDQAAIVHREAINMVEKSPDLRKACAINRSTWRISYQDSFYVAGSADAGGSEGWNGSIIADEIHAWKGRVFYNALKWAGAARRNPLFFIVSTFGDATEPDALWIDLLNYAHAVNAGTIPDERFFGLVYETPPQADWTDVEVAKRANPGLGNVLSLKKYEADLVEARNTPSLHSPFRRYRLNQMVAGGTPWLDWQAWQECGSDYTLEDLAGRECVAAIDLSVSWDMSAVVLVFQDEQDEDEDYPIWLWPLFFLPEDTINKHGAPESFRIWHREGHLIGTPGSTIDYGYLERSVAAAHALCPIFELTFDQAQAEKTTNDMSEELGIPRFVFPQTYTHIAEPTAEFERLMLRRKLRHPNHPILSWQAQHVQVKQDYNGHSRPVKPKKGDVRKIDGIVAAVMGLGRQMLPEHRARLGGGQLVEFV